MRRVTLIVARFLIIAIAISVIGICPLKAAADEIKITGSTTFAPLVAALGESFMKQTPTVKVTFTNASASDSVNGLISGDADIGCSARYIQVSESEKANVKKMKLVCHAVSLDCVLLIVNPSNNVKSLGLTQVADIFEGKITNWKDFDKGIDSKIKVITRETGSAMYEFFDEKVLHGEPNAPGTTVLRSNRDIVEMVSQDPAAIGYTSYSYVTPKVKVVPLIGLETMTVPTEHHPLSRKLLMCTTNKPSKAANQFVDFINSPDGKSVMQKAGYLP